MARGLYDNVNNRFVKDDGKLPLPTGPSTQTTNPRVNRQLSRFQPETERVIASEDVSVYDENAPVIITNEQLNSYRANEQGWWAKLGTSFAGGIIDGVGTGMEALGYTYDVANMVDRLMGAPVSSNWFSDIGTWLKEDVSQKYIKTYEEEINPTDGFMSNLMRWSNFRQLLDSAVGYGGSGALTGAFVGRVAGIISRTERVAIAGDRITKLTGINPKSLSAAVATNYAEGKVMGLEVYEEIFNGLQPLVENGTITQKQQIEQASDAADKFQLANMAFILSDYIGFNSLWNFKAGRPRPTGLGMIGKAAITSAPREYLEEVGQKTAQDDITYRGFRNAEENLGLFTRGQILADKRLLGDIHSVDRDVKGEITKINGGLSTEKELYMQQFNAYYSTKEGKNFLKQIKKTTGSEEETLKAADDHYLEVVYGGRFLTNMADSYVRRATDSFTSEQAQIEGIMGAISGPGQWAVTTGFNMKNELKRAQKQWDDIEEFKEMQTDYINNRIETLNEVGSLTTDINNSNLDEYDGGSPLATNIGNDAINEEEAEKQGKEPPKSKKLSEIVQNNAWATIFYNSVRFGTQKETRRLLTSKIEEGTDSEKDKAQKLLNEFNKVEDSVNKNRIYYNGWDITMHEIGLEALEETKKVIEKDKNVSDRERANTDDIITTKKETISQLKSMEEQIKILKAQRLKWKNDKTLRDAIEKRAIESLKKIAADKKSSKQEKKVAKEALDASKSKRSVERSSDSGSKVSKKKDSPVQATPETKTEIPVTSIDDFTKIFGDDVNKLNAEVSRLNKKVDSSQQIFNSAQDKKTKSAIGLNKQIKEDTIKIENLNRRTKAIENVFISNQDNKDNKTKVQLDKEVTTEYERLTVRGNKTYDPTFSAADGKIVLADFGKNKGDNVIAFNDLHNNEKISDVLTDKEAINGVIVKIINENGSLLDGKLKLSKEGSIDEYIISTNTATTYYILKESEEGIPYEKNGQYQLATDNKDGKTAGSLSLSTELKVDVDGENYITVIISDSEYLDKLSSDFLKFLNRDKEGKPVSESFDVKVLKDDVNALKEGLVGYEKGDGISAKYARALARNANFLSLDERHNLVFDTLNNRKNIILDILIGEFSEDNPITPNNSQDDYIDLLETLSDDDANDIYNKYTFSETPIDLFEVLNKVFNIKNKRSTLERAVDRGSRLSRVTSTFGRFSKPEVLNNSFNKMLDILLEEYKIVTFRDFIEGIDADINLYLESKLPGKLIDQTSVLNNKFVDLKHYAEVNGLAKVDEIASYQSVVSGEVNTTSTSKNYSDEQVQKNLLELLRNRVSKDIKNISGIVVDTTSGLVTDASNKVAYLSRLFKESWSFDEKTAQSFIEFEDLTDSISWSEANSRNFKVDSQLILEVDEDYTGDVNYKGKKIKYKKFIESHKDEVDLKQYIPIKIITTSKEIIGYLHTPDFIRPGRVTGTVSDSMTRLNNIRNFIVNKGRVTTKVIEKGAGKKLRFMNDSSKKTSDVVGDDVIIYIGAESSRLIRGRGTTNMVQGGEDTNYLAGYPYMRLPIADGVYEYVPLANTQLSEQNIRTIEEALRIFYVTDKEAELNTKSKMNLTTDKGLKTFLKRYLNITNYSSKPEFTDIARQRAMSGIATFGIVNSEFLIGGHIITSVFKGMGAAEFNNAMKKFNKDIVKALNVRVNIDNLLLDSKKFSGLEIDEDNKVIETNEKDGKLQPYDNFVKQNVNSYFGGFNHITESGEVEWSYTMQNTIYFDDSFANPKQIIDDKTIEEKKTDDKETARREGGDDNADTKSTKKQKDVVDSKKLQDLANKIDEEEDNFGDITFDDESSDDITNEEVEELKKRCKNK